MNKSNWILKVLVPVVAFIAIFILVKGNGSENKSHSVSLLILFLI